MEKITKLISKFKEKYDEPLQLIALLNKKYGYIELESNEEKESEVLNESEEGKEQKVELALFSYDYEYNKRTMERLVDTFGEVKAYSEDTYINKNNSVVEKKLLIKYEQELVKILDNDKYSDSEKLAEKYLRILKNTLLKLWTIKDYGTIVSNYFEKNGIRMESYSKGHKMSDDELCLLDSQLINVYKEKTDDATKNYEVIEMVQPIIHISYYANEEEQIEYKDICGSCRFYCFSGRRMEI